MKRINVNSLVPELEPGCNSWVVTSLTGRQFELYDAENVAKLVAIGWTAKTAYQHLVDLSKSAQVDLLDTPTDQE